MHSFEALDVCCEMQVYVQALMFMQSVTYVIISCSNQPVVATISPQNHSPCIHECVYTVLETTFFHLTSSDCLTKRYPIGHA